MLSEEQLERELEAMQNRAEELAFENIALRAELDTTRGAVRADDERLRLAGERAGMVPCGCDMAEHMADEIMALRAELVRANEARSTLREALRKVTEILGEGYRGCDPTAEQYAPAWRAFEAAMDARRYFYDTPVRAPEGLGGASKDKNGE